jgi:hypothetical protein
MNCDQFHSWLENRDFSDQSESDQAMKHKKDCQSCQQFFVKDNMLDQAIRDNMEKEPLPENLEKIVSLNLGTGKTPQRRTGTIVIRILSAAAGLGALVLLFLFVPTDFSARNDFGKSLVRDHLHHNYNQDLETIDNLDKWLSLHSSFGAAVPARFDSKKGYRFVGGAICVIKKCRTVHLVYREGDGLISLYIIDAAQVPADLDDSRVYSFTSNGYTVEMWKEQQQVFAVII